MDKISNLFLKVGGLLIFIFNISNINYYIGIFMQYENKSFYEFMSIVVAPNIFQVALSFLMFFYPGVISNKFVSVSYSNEKFLDDAHILKIEQMCVSVLGLYMACSCFSDLVFNVSNYIKAVIDSNYIDFSHSDKSNFIVAIIVTAVELFVSFLLITQNKKICLIISMIRKLYNDNDVKCEK
jgi:hypothetical protein